MQKLLDHLKEGANFQGDIAGDIRYGNARFKTDGTVIVEDPDKGAIMLKNGNLVYLEAETEPPSLADIVDAEGFRGEPSGSHLMQRYISGGGTLTNFSGEPVAYISKDIQGRPRIYVLANGETTPDSVDVDAVVTDPRYKPVLGPDRKYHPVEIPQSEAHTATVTKIKGGVSATYQGGDKVAALNKSSIPRENRTEDTVATSFTGKNEDDSAQNAIEPEPSKERGKQLEHLQQRREESNKQRSTYFHLQQALCDLRRAR
jgi:hypothetical protein